MIPLILQRASASVSPGQWHDDYDCWRTVVRRQASGPEGETSGPAAPAAEKGQTSRLEVPPKYYGPCTVKCLARQDRDCPQSRRPPRGCGRAGSRHIKHAAREEAMTAFAEGWRRK